jgi:hypothetical protein
MSRRVLGALVVGQALCLFAGLIPACTEDSPCDEDQTLRDGYCYRNPVVDAAAPAVDVSPSSEFGDVCTVNEECNPPTSYCAVQPMQTAGFCTAFGCDQDPSICPSGWSCMDLTPFGLAEHMCIPGA